MQPLSASCWHSSRVKDFSKRMLPHHEIASWRRCSSAASAFSALGGAASSTKWKPVCPVSATMASMRSTSVSRRRRVVARDVVEAHVAEAALLPVAAVRHGELVPAAVGPQPVHRVEHVEQRQVAVQRQAVPGRRADFGEGNVGLDECRRSARRPCRHRARRCAPGAVPSACRCRCSSSAEQRALAGVERDVVEVIEHARLGSVRAARC